MTLTIYTNEAPPATRLGSEFDRKKWIEADSRFR
jgi:hypothetical protein